MTFFPTDLTSFLEIIRQNADVAYSMMFAWASSHSLLMALFGGYAAHSGVFNLGVLIGVCWVGSFFGDVFRFWLGRKFGSRLFSRFPRLEKHVNTAARLAQRHYLWMILLHRYPHGIRGVAGFAYGMSALSWPLFLAVNFVAAGIWACAIVSAGYAFGQVSEKLMSDASSSLGFVMLVVFLGLSWILAKKLEDAAERDAKQTAPAFAGPPGSDAARRDRRQRRRPKAG
jgi:membrane protein DedA with SNARE-associated domain